MSIYHFTTYESDNIVCHHYIENCGTSVIHRKCYNEMLMVFKHSVSFYSNGIDFQNRGGVNIEMPLNNTVELHRNIDIETYLTSIRVPLSLEVFSPTNLLNNRVSEILYSVQRRNILTDSDFYDSENSI